MSKTQNNCYIVWDEGHLICTAQHRDYKNCDLFREDREKRRHIFAGVKVAASGGLDEEGIPKMAHYNTKGDTPVSARQLKGMDAYEVTYVSDSTEVSDVN